MERLLKDAKALVTGGNRGIGRAVAGALTAAGARVACASRDAETGRAAAEALGGAGRAWWFRLDVTDRSQVDAVVDEAAEVMGGLDLVVHSAGVIDRRPFTEVTVDRWHRVLETNLTGAFYLTRACQRHLSRRPADGAAGRIVHIASVVGTFGVPDNAPYVASKHGLIGLTRTAAIELAPRGITVNAICPGWTDTDMTDEGVEYLAGVWGLSASEARDRIIREMIPIGRLLRPEEVADAVVWLCSPEAAAITGQAIRVDGGQTTF